MNARSSLILPSTGWWAVLLPLPHQNSPTIAARRRWGGRRREGDGRPSGRAVGSGLAGMVSRRRGLQPTSTIQDDLVGRCIHCLEQPGSSEPSYLCVALHMCIACARYQQKSGLIKECTSELYRTLTL